MRSDLLVEQSKGGRLRSASLLFLCLDLVKQFADSVCL
jgi:hypothetical protein